MFTLYYYIYIVLNMGLLRDVTNNQGQVWN